MNKHQIRRIDSYVRLLWRLKRIARELNSNAAAVNLYRGVGADILSTEDTKQGKETSYAYRVARVTGSPVT